MNRPQLLHNIVSLGALHAVNLALTLLLIPYLTRALGVEGWGQVVFVQLVINYLIWIANWSFYLSATKKVSENRGDLAAIQTIYSTTIYAQWIITVGAVFALLVLMFALPSFRAQALLYIVSAGVLVGNALQPYWFLNGMEMVKESALFQIATKLLALPGIFLLVHDGSDVHFYFVVNAASAFLTGLACIQWIKYKYKICFEVVSLGRVIAEIRDGATLFISTVWANLYSSVIPMGLGILNGPAQLGYYNLADRVRGAAIQLIHPVTHAMFPRMCHLFDSNPAEAWLLLKKSGIILFSIVAVISVIIYVIADPLILTLAGPDFGPSANILKILVITVPIKLCSEFLMYQLLIPTGQNALQNKSRLYPLLLGVALTYPVLHLGGGIGAAWLSLGIELLIVAIIFLGVRIPNIHLSKTRQNLI